MCSIFIELFSPRVDPNVQGCSLPLPTTRAPQSASKHTGMALGCFTSRVLITDRLHATVSANFMAKNECSKAEDISMYRRGMFLLLSPAVLRLLSVMATNTLERKIAMSDSHITNNSLLGQNLGITGSLERTDCMRTICFHFIDPWIE